jgi:hypothetical protein
MRIVVSNLWPRAKYYDDVSEIAKKLRSYKGDPVIDACDKLASIESFNDGGVDIGEFYKVNKTAKSEKLITDESDVFGGLSPGDIAPEILRQYIFFTMVLRALLLKNKGRISAVVGYCSGIIPVLNAVASDESECASLFRLPDQLFHQLSVQDASVTSNVTEKDVVMCMVRLRRTGVTRELFFEVLSSEVGKEVYVTDWKADDVAAICAARGVMTEFLARLSEEAGGDADPVRLVPHGGLHTPLAAPDRCFDLEGGEKWRRLFERVQQSDFVVWTSAGRPVDPTGRIDDFETLMRDTLFRCVQTGKLVDWLRKSDDEIYCVGLPSVISDMFLGSGLRMRRDSIVGPAAL